MALTDMVVRQAKATGKDYTVGDFDGLSLGVTAEGGKSWHFRYSWLGKQKRMSLGTYPEVSLLDARTRRDEARALLAKDINPRGFRDKGRKEARQASEHSFKVVYEKWLAHRRLSLKDGRQCTLTLIPRIFAKDVLPALSGRSIYDVTRADLLEILGRIERRKALSVAGKVRSWLNQLFRYALVVVPDLERNPATDLDVVAIPQPPVRHNPFLRMSELPELLKLLRKYPGKLQTQLGVRLLLLTGVRTGELRLATPDQFHLEDGLWIIPPEVVKQLETKMMRENLRPEDIPPYIVPLSVQAVEVIRYMLDRVQPAQRYVFPGANSLRSRISENTLNSALKRMGYKGRLTGHGIRATLSTVLHEVGYPEPWVDAQLSHVDPNQVRRTYNHAEYVEQRRHMMQDWADRLDLFEQDQVEIASARLAVQLEGVPLHAGKESGPSPEVVTSAPSKPDAGMRPLSTIPPKRLPAVRRTRPAEQTLTNVQRERMILLDTLEAPHNLPVAEYAKLAGKSRRWITYEIQAGNLLSISLGNRGQRVPDWQLNPLKRQLVQAVLRKTVRGVDAWQIYHALSRPHAQFGGLSPVDAVTPANLHIAAKIVCCSTEPS